MEQFSNNGSYSIVWSDPGPTKGKKSIVQFKSSGIVYKEFKCTRPRYCYVGDNGIYIIIDVPYEDKLITNVHIADFFKSYDDPQKIKINALTSNIWLSDTGKTLLIITNNNENNKYDANAMILINCEEAKKYWHTKAPMFPDNVKFNEENKIIQIDKSSGIYSNSILRIYQADYVL